MCECVGLGVCDSECVFPVLPPLPWCRQHVVSCLGCCGITPGVGLGIGDVGGAMGALVSLIAAGSRLLMSTVLLCFEHVLLFYLYIYL